MAVTIRDPETSEAVDIAALHVETWRETYGHLLPATFFTDDVLTARRRMWAHILSERHPDGAVRVAEKDGALVGFALSGPIVPSGTGSTDAAGRQLYVLYLRAAEHGTGLGQALFDAVLGPGPGPGQLWVATANPRAIAFYRRNGFAFDGAEQTDPATPGIVEARMVR